MSKTTVARGSFFLRLRIQSDGVWVGQVEQISSGVKAKFHGQPELLERLAAMVSGGAAEGDAPEMPPRG